LKRSLHGAMVDTKLNTFRHHRAFDGFVEQPMAYWYLGILLPLCYRNPVSFFRVDASEREKLPTTTPTPHQKRQRNTRRQQSKNRECISKTLVSTPIQLKTDSHKLYVQGKGLKISLGRLLRRTFRVVSNRNQVDGQFPLD
jgi:hypothetical protein